MNRTFLLLSLGLLMACESNTINTGGSDTSVVDVGGEEIPIENYEGARIRILSPRSGDVLIEGEPADFEAVLLDRNGEELPLDGVTWTSDVQDDWSLDGLSATSDALEIGVHEITVGLELPTGDGLSFTVGGVQVQHPAAGTYFGTLSAQIDLGDQVPIPIPCGGGILVYVDSFGDNLSGQASCVIPLEGLIPFVDELAFTFEVDGDHDANGDIDGALFTEVLDFFSAELDLDGELVQDTPPFLDLEFEGDLGNRLLQLGLTGRIEAERISLEYEPTAE